MFNRRSIILLFLVAIIIIGCQPEKVEIPVTVEVTRLIKEPAANAVSEPRSIVPILNTEMRTYHSLATGRDYMAYVVLPMSYDTSGQAGTGNEYPVIYVTDGDAYTIPIAMAAAQLNLGEEMPEVITVGIGYGSSSVMDFYQLREEDMGNAGAGQFLKFLEEELIPDIESSYRADTSSRTLVGHSLGGTFAIKSLFEDPESFDNYISSSPGMGAANREEAYAEEHDDLTARLFVSAAGLDQPDATIEEEFGDSLEARGYAGLEMESMVLDGETHLSVPPRAFSTGLRWVFSK